MLRSCVPIGTTPTTALDYRLSGQNLNNHKSKRALLSIWALLYLGFSLCSRTCRSNILQAHAHFMTFIVQKLFYVAGFSYGQKRVDLLVEDHFFFRGNLRAPCLVGRITLLLFTLIQVLVASLL